MSYYVNDANCAELAAQLEEPVIIPAPPTRICAGIIPDKNRRRFCTVRLNRYNTGTLCGACTRRAREIELAKLGRVSKDIRGARFVL